MISTNSLDIQLGPNMISDSARYFKSAATLQVLREVGYTSVNFSAPYTPQRNGMIERAWGIIIPSARCMLDAADLGDELFPEAVQHATRVYNSMPTFNLGGNSPHEMAVGSPPDRKILTRAAFGAPVWVHRHVRTKGQEKGLPGRYLGYDDRTRAAIVCYRTPKTQVLVKTSTVHITVDTRVPTPVLRGLVKPLDDTYARSDEITLTLDDASIGHIGEVIPSYGLSDNTFYDVNTNNGYDDVISAVRSRKVYYSEQQAKRSPDGPLFEGKMQEEMQGLRDMRALKPIDESLLSPEEIDRAPSLMTLFNTKRTQDGTLTGKCRMVFAGSKQVRGVDYDQRSSATPRWTTMRAHLGLQPNGDPNRWHLTHLDVKKFFAHVPNSTPSGARVIARLPTNAVITEGGRTYRFVELPRALYGQVNASYLAQQYLFKCFRDNGWHQTYDPCAWVKGDARLVVWIDDIVVRASAEATAELIKQLDATFPRIKATPCDFLLGHHVRRDEKGAFSLSAQQYVADLMDRFNVQHTEDTPLSPGQNPTRITDSHILNADERNVFQQIIGACIHLANTSRPDLAFSTATLGQASHSPTSKHMSEARRMLQYINGTADYGIAYQHVEDAQRNVLTAYVDASYADSKDFRSQSGFVIYLNGAPVSWMSKTQRFVTTSLQEAEVVAAADAVKELVFLRELLNSWHCTEWPCRVTAPITTYEDNQGAIAWFESPTVTAKAKHYGTRLFYIRQQARDMQLLRWRYIPTKDQTADILTKSLAKAPQQLHTDKLVSRAYSNLVIKLVKACPFPAHIASTNVPTRI